MRKYFTGLDVHWSHTNACILDARGKKVKRGDGARPVVGDRRGTGQAPGQAVRLLPGIVRIRLSARPAVQGGLAGGGCPLGPTAADFPLQTQERSRRRRGTARRYARLASLLQTNPTRTQRPQEDRLSGNVPLPGSGHAGHASHRRGLAGDRVERGCVEDQGDGEMRSNSTLGPKSWQPHSLRGSANPTPLKTQPSLF